MEISRLEVPADQEQAMIVRQFVRLACHRYGYDALTDNVLLVADELVANALVHAANGSDSIEVDVLPVQRGVRIEVHDHDPSPVQLPAAREEPDIEKLSTDEIAMSGLQLVQSIAAQWGVDPESDGKVVWAELREDV